MLLGGVSCFFEGYGYHRDLHVLTHSFPTRRSSDLSQHRSPPQQRSASAAGICRFLRRNAPSILSSRKRGGICSVSFSPSHSCRSVKGSGTDRKSTRLNSSH